MMNLFNRIVIVLLILAAMVLIPLLLIFPEQAQYALRYAADIIEANLVWLNGLSPAAEMGVRVLLGGAGLLVFVIGLVSLALEVLRIRRKTVRLKDGSGHLMMDGISSHVAYSVDLLPDVLRVKPTVTSKGKNIEAQVYAETAPGINIPAKTVEIKSTVQQVLEEELGLQLKGDVKVTIKPVYPKYQVATKRGTTKTPLPTEMPEPVKILQPEQAVAWEDDVPPVESPEPEGIVDAPENEIIEVKAPADKE